MKKFSALLLTGIIGTSMLFAGLSGSATLENTLVDLDNWSFGMVNSTVIDAELDLHADTAGATGEGDIYAEINAKLTVSIDIDEDSVNNPSITTPLTAEVEITDASIVGDGWKVSILGVNDPADYAVDTIEDADDGYNYEVQADTVNGIAVTLDDYGTVSLGYNGDFDALGSSNGYVALESSEVEVAENMKAQVAASVSVKTKNTIKVGGSAKLAYEREGYSASLATDLGHDGTDFGADVAINSTSKYATVDAYFGKTDTAGKSAYKANDNVLQVQVVTDLNEFDVPVKLTVKGLDVINSQDLSLKADVTVNDELSAYVKGEYGIDSTKWLAGVGATYTVDAYTAKLNASFAKGNILAADASVESTTLVDGATLKLAWANGDDLTNGNLGDITASCKIEF